MTSFNTNGIGQELQAFVFEINGPNTNLLDKETPDNEIELRIPIKFGSDSFQLDKF